MQGFEARGGIFQPNGARADQNGAMPQHDTALCQVLDTAIPGGVPVWRAIISA